MDKTDINRYNYMESKLKIVNSGFISLPQHEMDINNATLKTLLNEITDVCLEDELFASSYVGRFYGGSYFEGLKIKRPDEYDICVKFRLTLCNYQIMPSPKSGFVHVKLHQIQNKRLYRIINGDYYLDSEKIMLWMHKILSDWLKGRKMGKVRKNWKFMAGKWYWVTLRRHGPAFTFRITDFRKETIVFDFVPTFVFDQDRWPSKKNGYRKNLVPEKGEWYVVPKPIKSGPIFLRTSFQEQDRALLSGKSHLKPVIRLIKKLVEKLGFTKIVSFYIKNMFLWQVLRKPLQYWDLPLSYIFMKMLGQLLKHIEKREILYFWNTGFNLIDDIKEDELAIYRCKLVRAIDAINKNPKNQILVAKYLLSRSEYKRFIKRITIRFRTL